MTILETERERVTARPRLTKAKAKPNGKAHSNGAKHKPHSGGATLAMEYGERITLTWRRTVRNVIKTGKLLLEAKERLEHGYFTQMIESKLPFGPRTAEKLMRIAEHPVLSNPTHESVLPPSYATLYEMTKLPHDQLEEMLANGTITYDTERREVAKLVEQCRIDGNYWAREINDAFAVLIRFLVSKKGKKLPELAEAIYRMHTHKQGPVVPHLGELAKWIRKIDGYIQEKRSSEEGREELRAITVGEHRKRQERLEAKRNKPISAKEQRRRNNARERMYARHHGENPPAPRRAPLRFDFRAF
jgi:hypothetical protein